MKLSTLTLSGFLVLLLGIDVASAASPSSPNLSQFKGDCHALDATHVRCDVVAGVKKSGNGKDWSDWYSIDSGIAPQGFRLESTEFHGQASDHRCGATEASPIAAESATKGLKTGTSYWYQCALKERDDSHALWIYSIQGVEGMTTLVVGGGRLGGVGLDFKPDKSLVGWAKVTSTFAATSRP